MAPDILVDIYDGSPRVFNASGHEIRTSAPPEAAKPVSPIARLCTTSAARQAAGQVVTTGGILTYSAIFTGTALGLIGFDYAFRLLVEFFGLTQRQVGALAVAIIGALIAYIALAWHYEWVGQIKYFIYLAINLGLTLAGVVNWLALACPLGLFGFWFTKFFYGLVTQFAGAMVAVPLTKAFFC